MPEQDPISQDEFVKQSKRLIRLINYGAGSLDKQYEDLRDLQRRYTHQLVSVPPTGANLDRVLVRIPPTVIRLLHAKDFPVGTLIQSRKYRINCNGWHSGAYSIDTLRDLRSHQVPLYLKEFLGM